MLAWILFALPFVMIAFMCGFALGVLTEVERTEEEENV